MMCDVLPDDLKYNIMSRMSTIGLTGNSLACTCRDMRDVAVHPCTIAQWILRWYITFIRTHEDDDVALCIAFRDHLISVFPDGIADERYTGLESDVLSQLADGGECGEYDGVDGDGRGAIRYHHIIWWIAACQCPILLLRLLSCPRNGARRNRSSTSTVESCHASALLLAAENDDVPSVTLLLDLGDARPEGISGDGMPLQIAAEAGSCGVCRVLLHRLDTEGLVGVLPTLSWSTPPLLLAIGTTHASALRRRNQRLAVVRCLLQAHRALATANGVPLFREDRDKEVTYATYAKVDWDRAWTMQDPDGSDVLHEALGLAARIGPSRGGVVDRFGHHDDGDEGTIVRLLLDMLRHRGGCTDSALAFCIQGRVDPDVVVGALRDACRERGPACRVTMTHSRIDDTAQELLDEIRGVSSAALSYGGGGAIVSMSQMTPNLYERLLMVTTRAGRMAFARTLLEAYAIDFPDDAAPMRASDALARTLTDAVWTIRCECIVFAAQYEIDGMMDLFLDRIVNDDIGLVHWPSRVMQTCLGSAITSACRRCRAETVVTLLASVSMMDPPVPQPALQPALLLAIPLRIAVCQMTSPISVDSRDRYRRADVIVQALLASGADPNIFTTGHPADNDMLVDGHVHMAGCHPHLTILSMSVSCGNDCLTGTLLDVGADPLRHGAQAVVMALAQGYVPMAKRLVSRSLAIVHMATAEERQVQRSAVHQAYDAARRVCDVALMHGITMLHRCLDRRTS